MLMILTLLFTPTTVDESDLSYMKGKWVVVSLIFNGQPRAEEAYKELQLEIRGTKYLITEMGLTASRTLKLDSNKKPKSMDITYDDGPNKGKTTHAIYSMEGDSLIICRHQQPERERPGGFSSEVGTEHVLIKWKRVK